MDFYHVLNRGVDKRIVFLDKKDRLRFMQGLYLYNNKKLVDRNTRRFSLETSLTKQREMLVHIHAFCLMDNHFHLLLSAVDDDPANISAFMRKLNMGYAKYFNEKYERSGSLWQGKYKSILIEKDAHFMYIPYYIHLNPLDSIFPEWRTGNVKDVRGALEYLNKYRWSSYLSYQTKKHYQSILDTSVLAEVLNSSTSQNTNIKEIITSYDLASASDKLE